MKKLIVLCLTVLAVTSSLVVGQTATYADLKAAKAACIAGNDVIYIPAKKTPHPDTTGLLRYTTNFKLVVEEEVLELGKGVWRAVVWQKGRPVWVDSVTKETKLDGLCYNPARGDEKAPEKKTVVAPRDTTQRILAVSPSYHVDVTTPVTVNTYWPEYSANKKSGEKTGWLVAGGIVAGGIIYALLRPHHDEPAPAPVNVTTTVTINNPPPATPTDPKPADPVIPPSGDSGTGSCKVSKHGGFRVGFGFSF